MKTQPLASLRTLLLTGALLLPIPAFGAEATQEQALNAALQSFRFAGKFCAYQDEIDRLVVKLKQFKLGSKERGEILRELEPTRKGQMKVLHDQLVANPQTTLPLCDVL